MVLVDGSSGEIIVDPSDAELREVGHPEEEAVHSSGAGRTAHGHPIALLANVATPDTVTAAARAGAEGIGLFRTEFCFLDRHRGADVEEQHAAYADVLRVRRRKPSTMRTLDAGADKPLPFVDQEPNEPNPALGVRGVPTSATIPRSGCPDSRPSRPPRQDSGRRGVGHGPDGRDRAEAALSSAPRCRRHKLSTVGAMIESPAAALTARRDPAVSISSPGHQDLAQYTIAADRHLGAVAAIDRPVPARAPPPDPARLRWCGARPVTPSACAARPRRTRAGTGTRRAGGDQPVDDTAGTRTGPCGAGVSLSRCRELAEQACGARTAEAARAVVLASR